MRRPAKFPPNLSTERPFPYSLLPRISPNWRSMSPQYQIIFNVSKTMSPSQGIVMQKPKRNKRLMPIKLADKNRITRLGTRCIWRVRMYDFVSRREAGAPSFIPATLVPSRSQRQSQKRQIILSSYLLNSTSTPRFTPDVLKLHTTAIQTYFRVAYPLIHLPSTLRTNSMLLKPF